MREINKKFSIPKRDTLKENVYEKAPFITHLKWTIFGSKKQKNGGLILGVRKEHLLLLCLLCGAFNGAVPTLRPLHFSKERRFFWTELYCRRFFSWYIPRWPFLGACLELFLCCLYLLLLQGEVWYKE